MNIATIQSAYDLPLLKFSKSNGKLSKRLIFSIPAGHTCPYAGKCHTFAQRTTGEIIDNPHGCSESPEFRCFAAMAEARFPTVRNARWYNLDLIKAARDLYVRDNPETKTKYYLPIRNLILDSLDKQPHRDFIRIHESGDFWIPHYMKAWMLVAKCRPEQKFYAYTKSLNYWFDLKDEIPDNFYLTASYGGSLDHMIPQYPDVFKRVAYVVYTEQEAEDRGLEIDHDDSHCFGDKPFALLVHGSQPAGSEAGAAIQQRKKEGGFVGYAKK